MQMHTKGSGERWRRGRIIAMMVPVLLCMCRAGLACSVTSPPSAVAMIRGADAIVRVRAMEYVTAPANANSRTTGEPDSTIRFDVLEVIRGDRINALVLPGYLSNDDDFNDQSPPYSFVRPNGRAGSCFANTYRRDAQFLLVLKQVTGTYTVNWYALGPVNEQLRSDDDAWLLWVRREASREVPATSDPPALVQELGTFRDSLPATAPSNGRMPAIEERRQAVYRELRVLNAAATPALTRGLTDADVRVRRGVALYLVWAGGNYARVAPTGLDLTTFLDPLVRALRDSDQRVKGLAAQAVGLIGPAAIAAVPDLLRMLTAANEGLRNAACIGLGGIGPAARDALPALRGALSDFSSDVRQFAQAAIDKIERGR